MTSNSPPRGLRERWPCFASLASEKHNVHLLHWQADAYPDRAFCDICAALVSAMESRNTHFASPHPRKPRSSMLP
eukprot:983793-Pyramimonas_sp.AAC.2